MTLFAIGKLHRSREIATALVGIGLLATAPAFAQDDADGVAEERETNVVASLRFEVGERLTAANTCLEEGDIECAQENIERVARIRDLNSYEQAQLYNFSAFLAFELDDTAGAIDAYQKMLDLPREELPEGLIDTSMRNLATLYLQEERWDEGLELYLEWLDLPFVTPSPDDYALLGNIYYQMERWADGVPALNQAIAAAEALGEMPQENWYSLRAVFHQQLEEIPELIDTLIILVENWTKRQHMMALAGQFSAQDRHEDVLTLYEAAHAVGFLESSTQWVQLANLYLNAETPYKAAILLEDGLERGIVESTQENWRRLAQSWQMASEFDKALPALQQASELAEDGQVDQMLGQSYVRLARWDDCVESTRRAIDRGGLNEPAYAQIQLGTCLLNTRDFQEARAAFVEASRSDSRREEAQTFIRYVDEEMRRQQANEEALAALARR